MLTGFEKRIADFIEANGLFGPEDRVLLAVSGGSDSTALLYSVCKLKDEGVLSGDFVCAHLNHQLRGAEAEKDEDFVVIQARNLNLSVETARLDVSGYARKNKLSIETAARKLRIESLVDIAKANNCNVIATAHQKSDNAETIIQRLTRGTGFRGLGGIWPMRSFAGGVCFVRPLLCISRDEIIGYLNGRGLKWRVDLTNEDCRYRRNFIRHRLIPALQADCSGSIVEQLFALSQSSQRFYNLVCSSVDKVWPALADCSGDGIKLDLDRFLSQHPAVKVELVRQSLGRLGSGERDLTQQHFERILQLAKQRASGKRIELPDGFVVRREYGDLIFERAQKSPRPDEQIGESIELKVPGQTRFGSYLIEATILDAGCLPAGGQGSILDARRKRKSRIELIEWFDFDKVKPPLVVRFRRVGDRFWPLGLAGEKRVGKFLTAAKVPQEIRQKLVIVADSERIIWVWPIRMSEKARVDKQTGKILELKINEE